MDKIFGTPKISIGYDNPSAPAAVSTIIDFGIKLFLLVAALTALFYMFWGAYDFITSSGDSDAISKARNKIFYSVIGLIMIFVILSIYVYVAADMLGIATRTEDGGWGIFLPRIGE
ncbi:MAG: hypothetical protein KatS3mg090_0091 [Patescibacteria group bacterium]|nr:MAG: hypothetical protein KatS3mg090_0091 [Patescibacteria group bacterium]